jgi:hypothetical protein
MTIEQSVLHKVLKGIIKRGVSRVRIGMGSHHYSSCRSSLIVLVVHIGQDCLLDPCNLIG